MQFIVDFENVSSGATVDVAKTMIAIRAADTAGHRARLLGLSIGPADDTAADLNCEIQLKRVDDVSAGGAGTPDGTPTPVPQDSLSRAAVITCGTDYVTGGVEPTTYGLPVWGTAMNRRNSILEVWDRFDPRIPIINRDQLLGLLITPRTGAAAILSGYLVFEEF